MARELCLRALPLLDQHNRPNTFALFNQLRRSVVSVEANIVEGYALQTANQFRGCLRIAAGSAAEVECLLEIAIELKYLPPDSASNLHRLVNETLALIKGLIRSNKLTS